MRPTLFSLFFRHILPICLFCSLCIDWTGTCCQARTISPGTHGSFSQAAQIKRGQTIDSTLYPGRSIYLTFPASGNTSSIHKITIYGERSLHLRFLLYRSDKKEISPAHWIYRQKKNKLQITYRMRRSSNYVFALYNSDQENCSFTLSYRMRILSQKPVRSTRRPGTVTHRTHSTVRPGSSRKPKTSTHRTRSTVKPGSSRKPKTSTHRTHSTVKPGSSRKPKTSTHRTRSAVKPGSSRKPKSTRRPKSTQKPNVTKNPTFTCTPRPNTVTINTTFCILSVHRSRYLTVTPKPASGQKLIWRSSHPDIVSVSSDGKILARKQGIAVIRCALSTNPAHKSVCTVKVR